MSSKRIRHEQINNTVHQYLKRRQFSENETSQKKESKWTYNILDMALKSSTNGEVTVENILSYSSISGDATVCEQQFTRLKNYISEASEPYKSELVAVLFPVFVHIYIHLLYNGHKAPAHKFYGRHIKVIEADSEYKDLLETIHKLYSRAELMSCKEATDFRESKYKVYLSDESLDYLKRHLKRDDNMMLLQIFNQNLFVETVCTDKQDFDLKEEASSALLDHLIDESGRIRDTSDAVTTLKQSIRQVRDGPPCLSSICFYTFLNAYQGLCTVDIAPNRSLLSAGFEDSTVKLWNITPGLIQSNDTPIDPSKLYIAADVWSDDEPEQRSPAYLEMVTMRGHNGAVYKSRFTSDSQYVLTASEDGTVRVWDLESHKNKACYHGHNYPVWDIDVSGVGGYFVSSSQDRTAKLWILDRIYPLRTFAGHSADVDCVKFHPNCNYIATGSGDRSVRLWTLQDGKSVRLLHGHRGSVLDVAFSPNGSLLASAGDDKRIRVWDLSTGTLYKELRGHTDTVHSLSFSKDSTMLASGGLDCSIKIWDVRKGVSHTAQSESNVSPEMLGSFSTKSATVTYLQYSKYNLLLAAGAI